MAKQQLAPGGLELVRSFVNTADREEETDELRTPEGLASWLELNMGARPGLAVSEQDLERAIALREALRSILLSHNAGGDPPPQAYATLDAVACGAELRLRFDESGSSGLRPQASGVSGELGSLVAIVYEAAADGTWQRLKACRDPECAWAFYDHTKNRSGAWCSMSSCGNRAKARAYRGRRSATEAS